MPFRVTNLASSRNPLIQSVRQSAARSQPTEEGLLLVEGPHLVDELLGSSWTAERLLLSSDELPAWEERARHQNLETVVIPPRIFASMAPTETTQGVIALAKPRSWSWEQLEGKPTLLLVLDGVQDPGNAGAIVRSAEAFGASGIVLLEHSVRIANTKFIRAASGSLFRIPIRERISRDEFLSKAEDLGWQLLALQAAGSRFVSQSRFAQDSAIIVGSEGRGIAPELLASAVSVTIPTSGVESLNAAVAASIALYEASRQRRFTESV